MQRNDVAVDQGRLGVELDSLGQFDFEPLPGTSHAVQGLDGNLFGTGDDHSHQGPLDRRAFHVFKLVSRGNNGQFPVVVELESPCRIAHIGAGHEVVSWVDRTQRHRFAGLLHVDGFHLGQDDLSPGAIDVRGSKMRHLQLYVLANFQFLKFLFLFPCEFDGAVAEQLRFSGKAPGHVPLGQILRCRVDDLLAHFGSVVLYLVG